VAITLAFERPVEVLDRVNRPAEVVIELLATGVLPILGREVPGGDGMLGSVAGGPVDQPSQVRVARGALGLRVADHLVNPEASVFIDRTWTSDLHCPLPETSRPSSAEPGFLVN